MPENEMIDGIQYEKSTCDVFEYRVVEEPYIGELDANRLESSLNFKGKEGWELTSVFDRKLFFKRRIHSIPNE
jgi:hypothetical protein